jgi:hypothetical protein
MRRGVKKSDYKPYAQLTEKQQRQVREEMTRQNCDYYDKPGMKYKMNENGNYKGEHLDPYLLSSMFPSS